MATTKKAAAIASSPSMNDEHKWRAESDLRTLMEAHAIHKDKARHGRVKAHAKEQLALLKGVSAKPGAKPVTPTK